IPSSGSTTSRIASSRSASSSSLGTAVSLIWCLLTGLRKRVLESHPSQQRAFHPRRVLRDTGECDAVSDYILVALDRAARGHHLGERRDGLERVSDALADHLVGQHRSRRLADRTALSVIGNVGDPFP